MGDEVITAGGIYGTIVEVSDTSLVVQIAPGLVMTLAREAVSGSRCARAEADEPSGRPAVDPVGATRVGDSTVADDPSSAED